MAVFLARFIPGVRVVAAVSAGASQMRRIEFVVANALGAMAWGAWVSALGWYGSEVGKRAIQRSNNDVGGRLVEMGETEFMVRSTGYISALEDLQRIVVAVDDKGTPVLLKHIANIQVGPELRRGILEWNGEGEAVGAVAE